VSNKVFDIEFSIAYVGFGGNTGGGEYFYAVKPEIVTVFRGQAPATLEFKLADHLDGRYEIVSALTSDSQEQISKLEVREQGRMLKMENAADRKTLILMSVLVRDKERGRLINCDPQVGNDPEIDP